VTANPMLEPKVAATHVRTSPASVPVSIFVVLETGPVVVMVFWVAAGAGEPTHAGCPGFPQVDDVAGVEVWAKAPKGASAMKATATRRMIVHGVGSSGLALVTLCLREPRASPQG